jgi:ketosteroid isomerase-like protein
MKHALLPVALVAVLVQVGPARAREPESPATPKSATLADEVKQMEKRYTDALMKKDLATLEKIWSHGYTFINGQGKLLSRAERLENVKTGATEIQSTEERDVQVRVYGDDAAVLVSHVTLNARYSGREASGEYRHTAVWIKAAGGWHLVANQITPIAREQ